MKKLIEQLKAQLLADKKKSAALGGLLCILVVVVVRALPSKSVELAPSAASAQQPPPRVETPVPQPKAAAAKPVVSSTPQAAEEPARRTAPRPPICWNQLQRNLDRDPFVTKRWSAYPSADSAPVQSGGTKRAFWTSLVGSVREYRKVRREETIARSKELAALQLQSTMTGEDPMAYVSGSLVREGQRFAGFLIVRIEERRVVLSKDGQFYELAMP